MALVQTILCSENLLLTSVARGNRPDDQQCSILFSACACEISACVYGFALRNEVGGKRFHFARDWSLRERERSGFWRLVMSMVDIVVRRGYLTLHRNHGGRVSREGGMGLSVK